MKRPIRQLQEGAIGAFQILLGEAGARALPTMTGMNRAGPTGLAIQALAALILGGVADRMGGSSTGKMVLAGGLSAPLKTLIVSYNVPILGAALSPAAAQEGVAGYHMGRYPTLGRYPAAGEVSQPLEGYAGGGNGMGAYYASDDNQYYYES